jgi:hypothetical protein
VESHPAEYGMVAKFAKLNTATANPFIDDASCTTEAGIQKAMFQVILKEQATAWH